MSGFTTNSVCSAPKREAVARDSVAHPEIEVVQAAGVDADDDLTRSRDRIDQHLELDDLGAAVAFDEESAHGRSLPSR